MPWITDILYVGMAMLEKKVFHIRITWRLFLKKNGEI